MNTRHLITEQENGKLINFLEKEYLYLFSKFFTNIEIKKDITQILNKQDIICGISEGILIYIFIQHYDQHDVPLLIDCLLNLTTMYISKEATKFVHGKISSIIKSNI